MLDTTLSTSVTSARVTGNALSALDALRDRSLAGNAAFFIRSLIDAASLHREHDLPSLAAIEDDDGSLIVEWIFPTRRIGLVFDADPSQSGWYRVSSIDAGHENDMGRLDTFNAESLIAFAMGKST